MAFVSHLLWHPRPFAFRYFVASVLHKSTNSDALDLFATNLKNDYKIPSFASKLDSRVPLHDFTLVRKTTAQLLKEINAIYDSVLCLDVRNLKENQLENLIKNSIEEENRNDLLYLMNECIKWDKLPKESVLLEVLEHLKSTNQNLVCQKLTDFCLEKGNFPGISLFQIREFWMEGNIDRALSDIEIIYKSYAKKEEEKDNFNNTIDLFSFLVENVLTKKSEAVLVKLICLVEKLEDYTILEQIWQRLFSSDWFSDQQTAILLFRKHFQLQKIVTAHLNYFTFLLLQNHNVETVYRLIELLLEFQKMDECRRTLGLLFDYQFWRKDLRCCSEIVQTSIQLGIPLAQEYDRKLLLLLLAPKKKTLEKPKEVQKAAPVLKFKF